MRRTRANTLALWPIMLLLLLLGSVAEVTGSPEQKFVQVIGMSVGNLNWYESMESMNQTYDVVEIITSKEKACEDLTNLHNLSLQLRQARNENLPATTLRSLSGNFMSMMTALETYLEFFEDEEAFHSPCVLPGFEDFVENGSCRNESSLPVGCLNCVTYNIPSLRNYNSSTCSWLYQDYQEVQLLLLALKANASASITSVSLSSLPSPQSSTTRGPVQRQISISNCGSVSSHPENEAKQLLLHMNVSFNNDLSVLQEGRIFLLDLNTTLINLQRQWEPLSSHRHRKKRNIGRKRKKREGGYEVKEEILNMVANSNWTCEYDINDDPSFLVEKLKLLIDQWGKELTNPERLFSSSCYLAKIVFKTNQETLQESLAGRTRNASIVQIMRDTLASTTNFQRNIENLEIGTEEAKQNVSEALYNDLEFVIVCPSAYKGLQIDTIQNATQQTIDSSQDSNSRSSSSDAIPTVSTVYESSTYTRITTTQTPNVAAIVSSTSSTHGSSNITEAVTHPSPLQDISISNCSTTTSFSWPEAAQVLQQLNKTFGDDLLSLQVHKSLLTDIRQITIYLQGLWEPLTSQEQGQRKKRASNREKRETTSIGIPLSADCNLNTTDGPRLLVEQLTDSMYTWGEKMTDVESSSSAACYLAKMSFNTDTETAEEGEEGSPRDAYVAQRLRDITTLSHTLEERADNLIADTQEAIANVTKALANESDSVHVCFSAYPSIQRNYSNTDTTTPQQVSSDTNLPTDASQQSSSQTSTDTEQESPSSPSSTVTTQNTQSSRSPGTSRDISISNCSSVSSFPEEEARQLLLQLNATYSNDLFTLQEGQLFIPDLRIMLNNLESSWEPLSQDQGKRRKRESEGKTFWRRATTSDADCGLNSNDDAAFLTEQLEVKFNLWAEKLTDAERVFTVKCYSARVAAITNEKTVEMGLAGRPRDASIAQKMRDIVASTPPVEGKVEALKVLTAEAKHNVTEALDGNLDFVYTCISL